MPRQKTEETNDKSLLLRLPERILKACQVRAQRERRSLNAQMLCLLEDALDKTQEKSPHELVGSRNN